MYLKNNNCIAHCWFSTQQLIATPFVVLFWCGKRQQPILGLENADPCFPTFFDGRGLLYIIVAIGHKGDFVGELMGNIFLPDKKRERETCGKCPCHSGFSCLIPPQFFPAVLEVVWEYDAGNGCSHSRSPSTENGRETHLGGSAFWYCWVTESIYGPPSSGLLLFKSFQLHIPLLVYAAKLILIK